MKLDLSRFKRIVALTGAGVSAESGIATFRDSNGLWENHRVEDVATPEAFAHDPQLVWNFYSMRRQAATTAAPNTAHVKLAEFARLNPDRFTLITQNVDGLHERASLELKAPLPLAMHGTLSSSRCTACSRVYDDNEQHHGRLPQTTCCQRLARPHIVWFGEMPLLMEEIYAEISKCDLFVSIGTSGNVYPAAGFLHEAKSHGATTACLNKEPIPQHLSVDYYVEGPATQTVSAVFA